MRTTPALNVNVKEAEAPRVLAAESDQTTLRVLSYNMFMRPPLVRNNQSDHKDARLDAFIRTLETDQYDVLALQEIFSLATSRQQRLIDAAHKLGYVYHTISQSPPWAWHDAFFPVTRSTKRPKLIDAGLLILSKYPIVEADTHIYNAGNQIDAWAAKQVLYARLEVAPGMFCHVFNTHMQASYFDNHPDINILNDAARHLQLVEMGKFIRRKTAESPAPALITGDFNVNSRTGGPTATVPVKVWDHPFTLEHVSAASCSAAVNDEHELDEYRFLVRMLSPCGELRDLLHEATSHHPVTYGDVCDLENPREMVLTHVADYGSRLSIDYIFFADCEANKASGLIEVVPGSTRVEPFFVPEGSVAQTKLTQLSDHYGVSTILRVNRNSLGKKVPA